MKREPEFDNWKDAWEYNAADAEKKFSMLPEETLLEIIKNRQWDSYYSIWNVIGKKGTVKNSSMILYNVLLNEDKKRDDLIRYHCAGALFKILGIESEEELRRRCQWDLGDRKESLKNLLEIINRKLAE